jgi:cyclopropane-fatty-acyl-phospholipid synthase
MKSKQLVNNLLNMADIKDGGKRPQDIVIHDERFYARVVKDHILGLGESYMDGWWDANKLDETFAHVIAVDIGSKVKLRPGLVLAGLDASVRNRQTIKRAKKNAEHHYNIGNDLYALMLDKRMVYSCGYWQGAKNLDEAQEQKLDLICRKLGLKKGMTVLEIGCGWGGFIEYAARKYGIKGVGITPASEQVKAAKQRVKGLDVKILQKDYRQITGSFDRIVSIGMFEHVGHKNYRTFFKHCDEHLKPGGMMLHHTIGGNVDSKGPDPWLQKYIFPNGVIPSLSQISKSIEGLFVIEDVHNFGPDYDKTLMAWHKNFNKNYAKLQATYDERFKRMWNFYLLMCAAGFRQRDLQLWQIVMRRREPAPAYRGVR